MTGYYWANAECYTKDGINRQFHAGGGYRDCNNLTCPPTSLGPFKDSKCHLCCYGNKTERIVTKFMNVTKYVTGPTKIVEVNGSPTAYYKLMGYLGPIAIAILVVAVLLILIKKYRQRQSVPELTVTTSPVPASDAQRNDQVTAFSGDRMIQETNLEENIPNDRTNNTNNGDATMVQDTNVDHSIPNGDAHYDPNTTSQPNGRIAQNDLNESEGEFHNPVSAQHSSEIGYDNIVM